MDGVRFAWVGEVMSSPDLEVVSTTGTTDRVAVDSLARAWRGENV
jgi:hypothetical protein